MSPPSTLTVSTDLQRRAVAHATNVLDLDIVFKKDWPNQQSVMGRSLVQQCDLLALVGLACVSPDGKAMAARVVEDRWKDFIRSFAPAMQTTTFLAVMRETDTTLVGGAAVQFVQEAPDWQLRDIDFVCGLEGFENFCIVLIEKLHGTVVKHEQGADINQTYLSCQTQGITRRCVIVTPFARFDVMCSDTVTPLTALTHTFSTHLMISVSADAICMAYPLTFFDWVGLVRKGERTDAVERGIERWEERGFVILDDVTHLKSRAVVGDFDSAGRCTGATRFFGDEHCLTFYFRNALIRTSSDTFAADFGSKSAWTAGWIFGREPCACYTCGGRVPILRESPWIADGGVIV